MIRLFLDHESHGWLNISIEEGNEKLDIFASYLSDVVESLITALFLYAEGRNETIAIVQSEPGEYRLIFKRVGENCELKVFQFEKNFFSGDIEKGTCVGSFQTDSNKLLREFLREFKQLDELGNEEYRKSWGYDFPTKLYDRFLIAYKVLNSK